MLTDREIIATLEMVRNENLDVRTVTLGINLLDCVSSNIEKFRKKISNCVRVDIANMLITKRYVVSYRYSGLLKILTSWRGWKRKNNPYFA